MKKNDTLWGGILGNMFDRRLNAIFCYSFLMMPINSFTVAEIANFANVEENFVRDV